MEPWPGFLDLLVPGEGPYTAARTVSPGAGAPLPLAYRDERLYGVGVGYGAVGDPARITLSPAGDGAGATSLPAPFLLSRMVRPGEAAHHRFPGFGVDLPSGSRFFEGPLLVRSARAAEEEGLPPQGEAIDLLPDGETLNEKGTLTFYLAEGQEPNPALGVYRWDPHSVRWQYEGGELDPQKRSVSLGFRRYGRFALLRDLSPPVIRSVRPAAGALAVPRHPSIEAAVEESGKGLDYDGVAFVLDGRSLESEFDPDRGRSRAISVPPLGPGRHVLKVVATDRAGNSSAPVEVSFTVR